MKELRTKIIRAIIDKRVSQNDIIKGACITAEDMCHAMNAKVCHEDVRIAIDCYLEGLG